MDLLNFHNKMFRVRTKLSIGRFGKPETHIYCRLSNGSLTESMHYRLSKNTKIKLITMIKQRRVILAFPVTAKENHKLNQGESNLKTSLRPQPTPERAIQEESIAIDRDWVKIYACSLPHNI